MSPNEKPPVDPQAHPRSSSDPAPVSWSQSPAPEGNLPDPWKMSLGWLGRKIGIRGLIIGLIIISLVSWFWKELKDWDKVSKLPGVSTIVSLISQESLPQADPKSFAVALARLENDKDRQHERLIVEALKELKGIQILRFDRTIKLEGSQPEQSVKAGHEKGRAYLKKTRAHVLIWGTILSRDGKSLPKLYWTTYRDLQRERQWGRYQLTDDLNLPDVFWGDLVDILRLLVVTYDAEFHTQEGHFIGDELGLFIEKVRQPVGASQGRPGWNAEARANVRFILANSLLRFGEEVGKNEPLQEAVTAYREVLKEWTPQRVPWGWAMTQNNLGNALQILGERRNDATLTCKAIESHIMAWDVF